MSFLIKKIRVFLKCHIIKINELLSLYITCTNCLLVLCCFGWVPYFTYHLSTVSFHIGKATEQPNEPGADFSFPSSVSD